MEYLVLYAYELVCTAIPAFLVYLALVRFKLHRRSDDTSLLLAAAFAAYVFALLHFTGAGTLYDALRFGFDLNSHQLNLVSFANFSEDVEGHLLNVLLFAPIGLLVPILFDERLGALPVVTMAAATSLIVEVSQLLNSRVTDIDDLLMNIVGALIGYGVFRLKNWADKGTSIEPLGISVATATIATAFLGRFFFYDEIGLAKMLFGF